MRNGPAWKVRGNHRSLALAMLLGALGLGGCAGNHGAAAQTSLYQQLGGQAGITRFVQAWTAKVGNDARINAAFAHTDMPHLRAQLVNLLGQDSGGPQVYTGPDMYVVHRGMHITNAQWNAFMEDGHKAMQQEHYSDVTQAELLGILLPMKMDIVGH